MAKSIAKSLLLIKRTVPVCPNCVMQEKALESAGIPFRSIDITHDPDAVEKYDISSIPVLIFEDEDSGEIMRFSGFRPAELIAGLLE